ncbi:UNVERIFIED_ORG: two-component sensor histidine kinase [Lacrimispora saccharolytica]|uniref:sensor histidine kinase n=1 Tax=Clostridium sp. M62/1 TaxID=411486 RepID=UPI0001CCCB84|nr:Signal transduction histidine kinase [[Clostridium] cf. saccharolyticum K10]
MGGGAFKTGKRRWPFHAVSMRIPLAVCILALSILPLMLQSRMLAGSMRQSLVEDQMINAQNKCLILINRLVSSDYVGNTAKNPIIDTELSVTAEMFNGRIVIVDRDFKIIADTFNLAEGKLNISQEVLKAYSGEEQSSYNRKKDYFSLAFPIPGKDENESAEGVLLLTASTENIDLLEARVTEKITFFQLVVFWVVAVFGLLAAGLLLKPFIRLKKVLGAVAEGDLEQDIRVDTYRETKEISEAVSQTLRKLKAVDQSRQEFVSNVSHELKTPITSIRVLADSLMGMEDVPEELYREFLSDISDEIDRESKIIDDLLTLVKADKSNAELNVEQININGLLEQILKRLRPIAKKRNIELVLESIREVSADVDEVKLSLALSNLVENAVKYNHEEGWVHVTLDADHKFFYVKVSDNGIGISQEDQEHVFERFYRVDKARSRETGGTGLGLAITKSIILMHQGAIKLQSKEGEGTTFTVRIPLNYIP